MSCPHEWLQCSYFYSPSVDFHSKDEICVQCGKLRRKAFLGRGQSRRIVTVEIQTENLEVEEAKL